MECEKRDESASGNTLDKEKPRGLAPIGVIVLLAAVRLLIVLHASNP